MILAITVTGKDRPGIIAALTESLYRAGGNLEDASMTILEGEFAMIFLASLKSKAFYPKLRSQLSSLERRLGLVASVKEITHRLVRGEKHRSGTTPYVVSVLGRDRSGIVYHISKLFADCKLNITDLNSKIMGHGRRTTYALVLEVDIPRRARLISALKRKLQKIQKKLSVRISLNPLDSVRF